MKQSPSDQGSSTLLVILILLLLSGSCLALLMATQTGMLVAAQQKVQVRLLAAADGGVELGVARGMAGAVDPTARTLGGGAPGAEVVVEVSGFVPAASGPCRLCMTNLEGTLGSLGGLRRVSHVVSATASAPSRSDGLPPPRRSVSAVVDLAPWPAGSRDEWDLAATGPRPDPLSSFVDPSDEDGNGAPDLGEPLSPPAIVRLRVGEGDRMTAVFGGGYDARRPTEVGNWLYIVGVESGALLYKRRLDAPATATPAAADLDGDGVADRLYAGTLAGGLYRVDVSAGARLEGGRVAVSAWAPRRVFETGGLPIRHPPAVVPEPETGTPLLALGTGTPLDPPPGEPAAGRFFVIVDKGRASAEAVWSLALDQAEELASPPLAAAGLLTFLTFRPTGPGGGEIRRYSLRLRSGDPAGGGARAVPVATGASRPSSDFGSPTRLVVDHPGSFSAPLLSPGEERLLETLRAGMPGSCRFGGARLRLVGADVDAGPLRLAVLPVCRIDVDWFEDGMF